MRLFLDTSAFAKRYVAEQGSDKVLAICQEADRLFVSVICFPELTSTLCRLVREKKLARAAYRQLKGDAVADLADVDICQITPEVLAAVVSLLEAHPLRAMDALHVACALACQPDAFVSADRQQLAAARKAGLRIVDVS
ncbi:MAG: type II toxin-antitoxin system VapC family toxin [Sulfuritalea sp.]|nr:type II toxin-antitoxin system VapC family toxin [Sulfuritalea sp.]